MIQHIDQIVSLAIHQAHRDVCPPAAHLDVCPPAALQVLPEEFQISSTIQLPEVCTTNIQKFLHRVIVHVTTLSQMEDIHAIEQFALANIPEALMRLCSEAAPVCAAHKSLIENPITASIICRNLRFQSMFASKGSWTSPVGLKQDVELGSDALYTNRYVKAGEILSFVPVTLFGVPIQHQPGFAFYAPGSTSSAHELTESTLSAHELIVHCKDCLMVISPPVEQRAIMKDCIVMSDPTLRNDPWALGHFAQDSSTFTRDTEEYAQRSTFNCNSAHVCISSAIPVVMALKDMPCGTAVLVAKGARINELKQDLAK